MRQFDLVVAMRLHALIFALKEGVPVVGLTYDAKVEHVLNQFGQANLNFAKGGKRRIPEKMARYRISESSETLKSCVLRHEKMLKRQKN